MFRLLLSFLCVFCISGVVEGQTLPPLTGSYIGYFSPSDRSMFPSLHPDSTYRYVSRDSLKPWHVALVRARGGGLEAYRAFTWGGWDRQYAGDSAYRKRARANSRYNKVVNGVETRFYVYIFGLRDRTRCYDAANLDRALVLLSVPRNSGLAVPSGTTYLGVDYWPYYEDKQFVRNQDVVGVIRPMDEEQPWDYDSHADPNACGFSLPAHYELEREEHTVPPLVLPGGASGSSGVTVLPRPGD